MVSWISVSLLPETFAWHSFVQQVPLHILPLISIGSGPLALEPFCQLKWDNYDVSGLIMRFKVSVKNVRLSTAWYMSRLHY